MGTLLNYLDKEIEERKQELQEKKGETLAVQDWELIGLIREIAEKQAERDKLSKKPTHTHNGVKGLVENT